MKSVECSSAESNTMFREFGHNLFQSETQNYYGLVAVGISFIIAMVFFGIRMSSRNKYSQLRD